MVLCVCVCMCGVCVLCSVCRLYVCVFVVHAHVLVVCVLFCTDLIFVYALMFVHTEWCGVVWWGVVWCLSTVYVYNFPLRLLFVQGC